MRYDAGLRQIESDVIRMGNTVGEMVTLAVRTALEEDDTLVEAVREREALVDEMEQAITERVIVTIGFENPIAHDLLRLSASLSVVSELEKVGDEAMKLAHRVRKLKGEFPFELRELLQDMAHQAQANLTAGLRLYSQYSPEAADEVVAQDDVVDRIYKTSRNLILARIREDPDNSRQLLRCVEVFHALEHVSDHASDIAKRIRACYKRFGPRRGEL